MKINENSTQKLSQAFELLLSLGFGTVSDEEEYLDDIDKTQLNFLLSFHRLLPQLYHKLAAHPGLDQEIKTELSENFKQLQTKSLGQSMELFYLIDNFNELQIPVICLKGPVLSYQLYGDFTKRSSNDLDLLVEEKDLDRALKTLKNKGYILDGTEPITQKQKQIFLKIRHHYTLFHPEKKITVELHWKLFAGVDYKGRDFPVLFRNSESLHFTDVEVRVLGKLDLALYLCVHGSIHAWFRLFWLHDLSKLLEQHGELFHQHLLQYAHEKKMEIHVWNAFSLLNLVRKNNELSILKASNKMDHLQKLTLKRWFDSDLQNTFPSQQKFAWNEYLDFYRYLYYTQGMKGVVGECRMRKIKPDNWRFFVFPDSIFFMNQWFSRPIWLLRKCFGS